MAGHLINSNGDKVLVAFIALSANRDRVREIVEADATRVPGGHRQLWFEATGSHVYITGLTGVILNKYAI